MSTNYQDVIDFHSKFGLNYNGKPMCLHKNTTDFRIKFMQEELNEFIHSSSNNDIVGMADALVDIVYVAMGTAYMMGLPWQELWSEVQRSNMEKVRALSSSESKRNTSLDVVKPQGWTPPNLELIINNAANKDEI
jgi:predicted HAD superfamily Cof-like phosphohydrolase